MYRYLCGALASAIFPGAVVQLAHIVGPLANPGCQLDTPGKREPQLKAIALVRLTCGRDWAICRQVGLGCLSS